MELKMDVITFKNLLSYCNMAMIGIGRGLNLM